MRLQLCVKQDATRSARLAVECDPRPAARFYILDEGRQVPYYRGYGDHGTGFGRAGSVSHFFFRVWKLAATR